MNGDESSWQKRILKKLPRHAPQLRHQKCCEAAQPVNPQKLLLGVPLHKRRPRNPTSKGVFFLDALGVFGYRRLEIHIDKRTVQQEPCKDH